MWKYAACSLGLLCFISAACGGNLPTGGASTLGSGGGGGAGGAGGSGSGGAPPGSFSLSFGPVTVQSGDEDTQCVVKRLGNPEQLRVGKIHNQLHEGSHHLIVYRTNDTEEKLTPFACQPFVDTLKPEKGSPLMITQKADELLTLPQGVAFTLDPNQMVRIEMHYINTTSDPLDVHAETTFIPIVESEFQHEAAFLFIGNPDISIQPHSTFTLGPTYFKLPANLEGSNFFGITGHTHQWGTNVTVASTTSKTGPDTMIYDVPNWQWSEPETVYQDPPFQIPTGGGFHFTCEYNNLSNSTVSFGESANAEMCFFWAYYYPSQGSFVCAHTDKFGGYDLCCPGNAFCNQIFP